ncbi:MAG: hypothetical protein FJ301_03620 [Planctomycetes bacterium]|nr:hypothetical protein [Planctomycetota bacterium]
MSPQGGSGLRVIGPVVQGGTITVEVGSNDTTVYVSAGSAGETVSHAVVPGKTNQLPVPPVPGGTVLWLWVGKGLNRRVVLVEVLAP